MNRRELLRWTLGAVGASLFGCNQGLQLPKMEFNPEGQGPLYCGWLNDPEAQKKFVETTRQPFLSEQNRDIKGTGEGKTVLLHKFFEYVTGAPLVPHRQEIGDCLVAGSMVTMADGSRKPIEQVKVGQYVLTHLGRVRKVTRTIRKAYKGKLARLKAENWLEDLVCTPDHLIKVNQGEWEASGQLSEEDIVYIQSCQDDGSETIYDLLDILPDAETEGDKLRAKSSGEWVNRYIRLDAKLAYVIGAYLAEGGCSRAKDTEQGKGNWSRVDFNLSSKEGVFADTIAATIEKAFDFTCKITSVPSKPTVKYVRCNSTALASFFKYLMPGNTYTKKVPTSIFTSTKDIQLQCLLGWLEGDGSCPGRKDCKADPKRGGRAQGTSVSKELIIGLFQLANRCGFSPKAQPRCAVKDKAEAYNLYFNVVDTAELYPAIAKKSYVKEARNSLGLKCRLEKVSQISKAATTVYCLDVAEDHSFVANGYTVHNCVSHAFGLGVDILTAVRMAWRNKQELWLAKCATEIIYAGARVEVGGGRTRGDGAMGVWAASFVRDWGVLLRQAYLDGKFDYTNYSGTLARKLGGRGVPNVLESLCRLHPLRTCSIVNSWEECRDAIANGYPVAMCSDTGFKSIMDPEGFLEKSRKPWYHGMLIHGAKDDERPGGLIQNSWGANWIENPAPVSKQPAGSFWADADVIDRAMRQGDSIALSGYVGYPRVDIPDYILW